MMPSSIPNHHINIISQPLVTSRARSLLILPQTHQQLPESLLSSTACATPRTLSTQIDQLRDSLPARTAGTSVLPVLQEVLSFTTGLRDHLLFLGIIVLVEVINVLLRSLDGLSLLLSRFLRAVLERQIASFAPLTDNLRFGLVGGSI